ncbi:Hypp3522 [Branchiostoma lanceolatum]|uniref:Hypp3522 protein n=1 Tax=Branchiostoma lanceolatum TaxID=7740 RepID=A0A8K0A181_BRALA|nr:Hypp3522 [Branchiostoma lanceolatum]
MRLVRDRKLSAVRAVAVCSHFLHSHPYCDQTSASVLLCSLFPLPQRRAGNVSSKFTEEADLNERRDRPVPEPVAPPPPPIAEEHTTQHRRPTLSGPLHKRGPANIPTVTRPAPVSGVREVLFCTELLFYTLPRTLPSAHDVDDSTWHSDKS